MSPSELHPEPLIERERRGALDPASREQLDEHLARCAACAMERVLAHGFDEESEPDEGDRERAARVVARMFAGDPPFEVGVAEVVEAPVEAVGSTEAEAATARKGPVGPERSPEPRPGLPLVASLVASLAVHAALLALVLLLASAVGTGPQAAWDPIEMELVGPAPSAIPTPEVDRRAPISEPPTVDRRPTTLRPHTATEPTGRQDLDRTGVTSDTQLDPSRDLEPGAIEGAPPREGAPTESGAARRDRLAILLAPGNVARGGFVVEGQPTRRGAPAGIAPLHDRGLSGAEIGRNMSAGLRSQAMTKAYTAREHPRLQRRSDGTQVYEGPRFAAVIRPDGSVDFQDHGAVQPDGFSASGSFDATDLFMQAAGQDPLAAERDWFMRETEELRHGLEAQHRRREMSAALGTLRGRLARVWATTSRSPAARRRRIFSMWDDMAEDDSGREARRLLIEFIRDTIPVGSDDAYGDGELVRLNASRESREEFAPY